MKPSVRHYSPKSRKRVLLALYWWEDRILEGVAKVAAEKGWILDCRMRWLNTLPDLSTWKGDGIIANPGFSKPLLPLIDLIQKSEVPTVGLQSFGNYPYTRQVLQDHEAMGAMAASHFISLGFKDLAYVTFAKNPLEQARYQGFYQTAQEKGIRCREIEFENLEQTLKQADKPQALWAANDLNALEVATKCLDAGYKIPEEIAMLGVDDTHILCDLAEVPLSSVNCNFENLGETAAHLLDDLMHGRETSSEPIYIQPRSVTQRRSTDTLAVPDMAAGQALRIIRDRFRTPLTIPQIASEVGVSVRQLQTSFQQHLGFTMIQELTRVRVKHAEQLLATTDFKLDAIALESGFSNRFHFIRAFQRITGISPSAFRKTATAS